MFSSRSEVDKHVENCLKRITNEKERNLRSLTFAKLYYKVGDYQQARRYVQMYVNIKSTSVEAQHLLGNCLQKLGQKEAAADAYRASLSLDPTQTSLILKLCQLLAENDMDLDSLDSAALYYCERAQTLDPGNHYAQLLREKLLARSSRDPNDVTQLLLKEVENRPGDAECAVRLLKHLSHNNQQSIAVNHILLNHSTNTSNADLFLQHASYVNTSANILLRYHRENSATATTTTNTTSGDKQALNWQFWMLLITILDALVALSSSELTASGENKGIIWNTWIYDQMLLEAVKAIDSCPDKQLVTTFLLHHRGQISYHLTTLLLRQAKLGLLRWREAVSAALPLLFAGYNTQPPDTSALWLEHSTVLNLMGSRKKGKDIVYDAKALVKRWNIEASNRCSQLGYVLYALGNDRVTEMIERVKQGTTGLWREQLYKKLFVPRDYQSKMKSSYFTTNADLLDIPLRFPECQTLHLYASVAQLHYPDSLHHLIWLYLNQKRNRANRVNVLHDNGNLTNKPDMTPTMQYDSGVIALAELSYPVLSGSLPLSVQNLGNCAAETLNILDIQAFVYCATLCCTKLAKRGGHQIEEQDRPPLLPSAITEQLGSSNQINWLKAAFRVLKGESYFSGGTDKNELRLTLIRGIEVIRCIGNHGIEVSVLVQLARIFQTRARNSTSHSEIEFNEARAELYWKAAMPLLERLKNKHSISYSSKRLFESQNKQLSSDEVENAIEDGKLFYGVMYLKKNELERALGQFKNLKDPYSSYYQAQIYEAMATEHHERKNTTAQQRTQSVILFTQALDCLYLTLDRLRDPSVDRNHPLNAAIYVQIQSVERKLAQLYGYLDGLGDGHHHEDTEVKEDGDGGDNMVTAMNILSKSLHNSSLDYPTSYEHSTSHHIYSTPTSSYASNSTPNVPESNSRLQLFPPSAILRPQLIPSPSLRRDDILRNRAEARPSPERLDAQLRQLSLARDATSTLLMEQNRAVLETHKALLEELKGLREGVDGLTQTVSAVKGMRPAFDELKNAVEDLQGLRNLPDIVHEIKREIAELKNSKQQQQQISDEDLYNALEEEYGADFTNSMPNSATANPGLNSTLAAAALGGGLYQNLPRMAAAAAAASAAGSIQQMGGLGYNPAAAAAVAAAAAGIYPGIYPGMYPPYSGLAITQGSLPFVNHTAGASDSHHAGLPTLGDYRNPLTHPQLSHHTYPGPPPPTVAIKPPAISSNMQMPPLNYQPPTSTFGYSQQQPGNIGMYSAGQSTLAQLTTLASSPHGGMAGVQLPLNMFKDTASVPAGSNKTGFGGITAPILPQPQQQQANLSQGLTGFNLFGNATSSAPAIACPGGSVSSTTSTGLSVLSFGNITSSSPAISYVPTTITISPATSKPAPVNVVITNSDPLPTPTTTKSPILSVVVPPQHIKQSKQQPHNYQIPLPATGVMTTPSVLNQPVGVVNTQGMLASVGPPIYSALDNKMDKSLDRGNNRSNISSGSIEEHDAHPDFKPIIPLPDEVEVITGEEDEKVLFCARGKLHRFVDTEWKERGTGDIKILQNKYGKVRILMRRERIHKICANHYITADMQFGPKAKMDTAYVWIANDFADETLSLEKFCIRFKTADIAKEFALEFQKAQQHVATITSTATNLGGFVFSSTPAFKPKSDVVITPILSKPTEVAKSSPFAGFTFNTTSKSDSKTSTPIKPNTATKPSKVADSDELIPTAEFKLVTPLPMLGSIKTGDENGQILFECHSKLLRFDGTDKIWKELCIGQMKIIKVDKIVKLWMRHEQVFKVCCNHQLFRCIDFSKMPNTTRVINWCVKDNSEGVSEIRLFALKFNNEELANEFMNAITIAKELIDSNGNLLVKKDEKIEDSEEHEKKIKTSTAAALTKTSGFGDKFKLKSGSWACKNCYIHNEGKDNYCVACETAKNDSVPKKTEKSTNISFGSNISFGIPSTISAGLSNTLNTFAFGTPNNTATNVTSSSIITNSFGNAFKPEEGSWECKECYVRNKPCTISCSSCDIPKEGAKTSAPPVSTSTTNSNLPSGLTFLTAPSNTSSATPTQFKFGFPSTGSTETGFTFGGTPGISATTSSFTYLTTPSTTSPKASLSTTAATSTAGFTFGTSSAHTFEFQPRHSPRKHSSSSLSNQSLDGNVSGDVGNEQQQDRDVHTTADGGDDSFGHVDEEDNIYFKPVIPLPDEIPLITGEEDETVLFEQRAKLYRFVNGQWKERGTGNIKLLIKEGTCKARAVMRREYVHKLCLNHSITPEINYKLKNEKSWQFAAADFSEGDIEYLQFCLRFHKPEIALEFKAAIDDIMTRISAGGSGDSVPSGSKIELSSLDFDDIVFVSETEVTDQEINEALKLNLPPKFMSYRQLSDCACEQCKKDDVYYNAEVKSAHADEISKQSPSTVNKSAISGIPISTTTTESLGDLIQKPELTATASSTTTGPSTIFGGVTITDNTGAAGTSSKTNFFGLQPSSLNIASSGTGTNTYNTMSGTSQLIFGTPATTTTSLSSATTNSIFSNSVTSNTSIFGGRNASIITPSSTTNLFTSPAPTSAAKPIEGTTNVFGTNRTINSSFGTPSSSTSIFSTPTNKFATSNTSSSTDNIFETPTASIASTPPSTGLFGFSNATPTKPTGNIFGGQANIDVATNFNLIKDSTTSTAPNELMFTAAADSKSFASVAAGTGTVATSFKSDSNFIFSNTGAKVFAHLEPRSTAAANTPNTRQDDGENDGGLKASGSATENYDPYYEPIISLPDEIVVTTGEENEEVKFCERSKLFRWIGETKEWKERGVGNMKLLFNPQSGVYRLLLRRDVVHKIVLNCRVTKEMDLLPMNNNDKCYIWMAHNFLEETGAMEHEKLAAQFKNINLACLFSRKVQEAINDVKMSKQAERKTNEILQEILTQTTQIQVQPTNLPQSSDTPQSGATFSQQEQNVEYGEDDEEESDDGDGESEENILSYKPCKLAEQLQNGNQILLGDGMLQIYYDEDCFGNRILFTKLDSELISNTLIGINTLMTLKENQCLWTSVEWARNPPAYRNLIATFNTEDDAQECYANYKEGVSYAQQSDINDVLPPDDESYE